MKWSVFFIVTLIILLPQPLLSSYTQSFDDCCVNQPQLPTYVLASDGYINVNVSEAKQMIETNPSLVILDVRTLEEYNEGHIENAVLIPVSELESRLDELDGEKDMLVYCRSGGRSATASQILVDNGFANVYNMLGGITAWRNEGYWIEIIHEGDLIIDGIQTFTVENCTYMQKGDIYIRDSAKMLINDAIVMIDTQSDYQYNIYTENHGAIEIDNSTVKPSVNWHSRVRLLDDSRLNVNNTKLDRLRISSSENSYLIIEDSILQEIEFFDNLNISLHEIVFIDYLGIAGSNIYLYGNVSFFLGTVAFFESNATRNYNIITKDTSDNPVENAELNLFDKNDTIVWNGVTDNLGKADFNLTFTDNNYTNVLELEAVKGDYSATMNVWLFSDTPIVLTMKYFADLNADGTINILDISVVAMAFGSTPEDPNWNIIADLNNDQIVNILDISTIAMEFGKTV